MADGADKVGKPDEWVTLGCLGAPWGVKGWLKLISYADPPENILDYPELTIRTASGMQLVRLEGRPHGNGFVAHIEGCEDRDLARAYTGKELLVEKARLPELDDSTWYWHQLTGLQVVNLRNEVLGSVEQLLETGANDVLVVVEQLAEGGKEERLIPFVQGQVVHEVDLEQKLIRVDWEKDY